MLQYAPQTNQQLLEDRLEEGLEEIKSIVRRDFSKKRFADTIWPVYKEVNKIISEEGTKKAVRYAQYYHKGQWRQSGNPFILHPAQVSYLLAFMGMDDYEVQAGWLHDVPEKNEELWDFLMGDIGRKFGSLVHLYVNGVSNRSRGLDFGKKTQIKARKVQDYKDIYDLPRLALIKLADNGVNMRSRRYLGPKYGMSAPEFQESQRRASEEFYLPLAREIDEQNILPMKLVPYFQRIYNIN